MCCYLVDVRSLLASIPHLVVELSRVERSGQLVEPVEYRVRARLALLARAQADGEYGHHGANDHEHGSELDPARNGRRGVGSAAAADAEEKAKKAKRTIDVPSEAPTRDTHLIAQYHATHHAASVASVRFFVLIAA